jgi:hypothetical protein
MLEHLFFGLTYSAIGVLLLGTGFLALDLLTPGRLGRQIMEERSMSAALIAAAGMLGLGLVIFTAIWTNAAAGFGSALAWTVAFGLLGIVAQTAAFLLLDLITPGRLGDVVTSRELHPGAVLAAAGQLAVALVVVASIA